MAAWAKDMKTEDTGVHMLADPRCEFSSAIGCTQDNTDVLGNIRSRRYSMARACVRRLRQHHKLKMSSARPTDRAGQRDQVRER
jgi:peroxiredoxin